jgi:uncharacterized protein YgbK (DUF1537 family)
MNSQDHALITFYGDDFTGSSDALGQYHRFGLHAIMFFKLPPRDVLEEAARTHDVVGIAGISRSLPTEKMEAEVRPVFEAFRRLGSAFVQYKICSTFDSSPEIGSFGRVLELGREIFGEHIAPVVPAQPEFGRYTVFGNHFAVAGGGTYRLDRHPTMSRHPSTPIDEADLTRYLARQTALPIGLIDLKTLASYEAAEQQLQSLEAAGVAAVVIDALEDWHLHQIGKLVWKARPRGLRFGLGSGGLSYGIGSYLAESREAVKPREPVTIAPTEQIVVVSGSCAPRTAEQIEWALAHGWTGIRVDPLRLLDGSAEAVAEDVLRRTLAALESGRSTVVYTATGPDDASIAQTKAALGSDRAEGERLPRTIGTMLGRVINDVLTRTPVRRFVVAGGDTSSYTMRAVDAYGIEIESNFIVAGALCRLRSANPAVSGAQVMLKGGQVGDVDLFEHVRVGHGA